MNILHKKTIVCKIELTRSFTCLYLFVCNLGVLLNSQRAESENISLQALMFLPTLHYIKPW